MGMENPLLLMSGWDGDKSSVTFSNEDEILGYYSHRRQFLGPLIQWGGGPNECVTLYVFMNHEWNNKWDRDICGNFLNKVIAYRMKSILHFCTMQKESTLSGCFA